MSAVTLNSKQAKHLFVKGTLPAIQVHFFFFYNNAKYVFLRSMHIDLDVTYFRTVGILDSINALSISPWLTQGLTRLSE